MQPATSSYSKELATSNGFSLKVLEANRQGRLSLKQFAGLVVLPVALRFTILFFITALVSVCIGLGLLTIPVLSDKPTLVVVLSSGIFVIPCFELRREIVVAKTRAGHVQIKEGVVKKTTGIGIGVDVNVELYYYVIGDLQFSVSKAGYEALVEGKHRVYYVSVYHRPSTKIMLSLEPLDL